MKPEVGEIYHNIKCVNFVDRETGRIRVRPLPNQGLSTTMYIECSKSQRTSFPMGTLFITEYVKVCKKPDGRLYLRAKDQWIEKL